MSAFEFFFIFTLLIFFFPIEFFFVFISLKIIFPYWQL